MCVGFKQGHTVIYGGVLHDDLIHLLVDLPLCHAGVLARHFGKEANVIVDERLTGHGELGPVGVQLAQGVHAGVQGAVLQLSALGHLVELAAADGVFMGLAGLEVRQAALAGPQVIGGGHKLVLMYNGFLDSLIQNSGERGRGGKELAHRHVPQVVLAHAQQGGGGPLAAPGHALDHKVPHRHAAQAVRLSGRIAHRDAGTQQQGVHRCVAELIALAVIGPGAHGAAVGDHELHRRLAHLVHGLAAADVLRRIHAHLPAQGHNVAVALAFCLHRRLSGCVVSAVLALCAGRLTGSAVALRRGFSAALVPVLASRVPGGVNLSLELVKLRLLLAGQAPALVPGAVHNRLLPGNHFLNVHCFLTS